MKPPHVRYRDGVVQVSGELRFHTVPGLDRPPWPAEGAPETLEVDLSGVARADSAGLALLLEWARAARRQGRVLRFRHTPEQLKSLAHVTGVDQILDLD